MDYYLLFVIRGAHFSPCIFTEVSCERAYTHACIPLNFLFFSYSYY